MCAAVEKVALAQSLSSFLTAGRLPAMAAMPYAPRAEEFLLSLTSVCHELNRCAAAAAPRTTHCDGSCNAAHEDPSQHAAPPLRHPPTTRTHTALMHDHCTRVSPHWCRYAIGRASVGDVRSVALCGGVVAELFRHFLKFDFRNGELRRRYDSVKYCVRRMEDILCVSSLYPLARFDLPWQTGRLSLESLKCVTERATSVRVTM